MDILKLLYNTLVQPTQAMSRTTHTPITFGLGFPGELANYLPSTGHIVVNALQYPQTNPDLQNLGSVLRHEQVHAIVPQETIDKLTQYFQQNPSEAQAAMTSLGGASRTQGDVQRLAAEVPAYAAQGYGMGLNLHSINQITRNMPDSVRQTYLKLAAPGGLF